MQNLSGTLAPANAVFSFLQETNIPKGLAYYITFPERVIFENIIPRNVINRGAAEVDNHISRDDIFDFHALRERYTEQNIRPFFSTVCFLLDPW